MGHWRGKVRLRRPYRFQRKFPAFVRIRKGVRFCLADIVLFKDVDVFGNDILFFILSALEIPNEGEGRSAFSAEAHFVGETHEGRIFQPSIAVCTGNIFDNYAVGRGAHGDGRGRRCERITLFGHGVVRDENAHFLPKIPRFHFDNVSARRSHGDFPGKFPVFSRRGFARRNAVQENFRFRFRA